MPEPMQRSRSTRTFISVFHQLLGELEQPPPILEVEGIDTLEMKLVGQIFRELLRPLRLENWLVRRIDDALKRADLPSALPRIRPRLVFGRADGEVAHSLRPERRRMEEEDVPTADVELAEVQHG